MDAPREGTDVVSEDVLYQLLDRDANGTIQRLRQSKDHYGLALALCYGTDLPDGAEWGSRTERAQWLLAERARNVRKDVAHAAVEACDTEEEVVRFWRTVLSLRGKGPLVRWVMKTWHDVHGRRTPLTLDVVPDR